MKKYFVLAAFVMLLAAACNKQPAQPASNQTAEPPGNSQQQTPPSDEGMGTVNKIQVFFIAPEDNGKSGKLVGCGDSVVAVEKSITPTIAPLRAALDQLLGMKETQVGESGLYNSLAASNVKVESVSIVAGKATVRLAGQISLGGVCDDPRLDAQIRQTVMQFSSVKSADIFINGQPIADVLSGKGKSESVYVFFPHKNSKQEQCKDVSGVERVFSPTSRVATTALSELLKGPSADEKAMGYATSLPAGSKLNSLRIINGVAEADFNAATESGGGSCDMSIRVEQIRQTLLQFPTVQSVKISINGRTEDIFQP